MKADHLRAMRSMQSHDHSHPAQQVHGLAQLIGSQALAQVMGPNPDIAKPIHDAPEQLLICEACAVDFESHRPIAVLAEISSSRRKPKEESHG